MDDRLARMMLENNFLDRLQKAQDDISLLQKLSVSNSGNGIDIATGLADGAYSGYTEFATAGAALSFGELVYLQSSDSRWEKVDASAYATCHQEIGICVLAAAGDGSETRILFYGNVRADAIFPTMTVGAEIYAGTTAGTIVGTPPSGNAGEIIRHVGHANTANELHFEPSGDYYEIG